MNNSVANICIQLFAEHVSQLSDTYLGIELLGLMVTLLTFSGTTKLFYKLTEPFHIPTINI